MLWDQITFEKEAGYAILIPKKQSYCPGIGCPDHQMESLVHPIWESLFPKK